MDTPAEAHTRLSLAPNAPGAPRLLFHLPACARSVLGERSLCLGALLCPVNADDGASPLPPPPPARRPSSHPAQRPGSLHAPTSGQAPPHPPSMFSSACCAPPGREAPWGLSPSPPHPEAQHPEQDAHPAPKLGPLTKEGRTGGGDGCVREGSFGYAPLCLCVHMCTCACACVCVCVGVPVQSGCVR